jgi:hypothetical protein
MCSLQLPILDPCVYVPDYCLSEPGSIKLAGADGAFVGWFDVASVMSNTPKSIDTIEINTRQR